MDIDKDKYGIMRELEQRDFVRELHHKLTEGLVWSIKHEYLGTSPLGVEQRANCRAIDIGNPVLYAMVKMLVSNFLNNASRKNNRRDFVNYSRKRRGRTRGS